jgi:hypothetical protein
MRAKRCYPVGSKSFIDVFLLAALHMGRGKPYFGLRHNLVFLTLLVYLGLKPFLSEGPGERLVKNEELFYR